MTNLNFLFLALNELTGTVPSELGLLSQLTWLDLSKFRPQYNLGKEFDLIDCIFFDYSRASRHKQIDGDFTRRAYAIRKH